MSNGNTANPSFDESEWQQGAKDGPSFRFEPVEEGSEPTPRPEPGQPDDMDWEGGQPRTSAASGSDWDTAGAKDWERAEPPPRKPRASKPSPRNPDYIGQEDRNFAMIAHGAGVVSVLITGGTVGWLVPLCIWLIKKEEGGFAASQALEALNFQITIVILGIISAILCLILIGIPMLIALAVIEVVFSIFGAIKTSRGEHYEYPINFRLIAQPGF